MNLVAPGVGWHRVCHTKRAKLEVLGMKSQIIQHPTLCEEGKKGGRDFPVHNTGNSRDRGWAKIHPRWNSPNPAKVTRM